MMFSNVIVEITISSRSFVFHHTQIILTTFSGMKYTLKCPRDLEISLTDEADRVGGGGVGVGVQEPVDNGDRKFTGGGRRDCRKKGSQGGRKHEKSGRNFTIMHNILQQKKENKAGTTRKAQEAGVQGTGRGTFISPRVCTSRWLRVALHLPNCN